MMIHAPPLAHPSTTAPTACLAPQHTRCLWPGIFLSGNGCRLTVSLYLASCGPSQPSSGMWRGTSHTYTHYFVDDRRRFSDHEKIETAARRSPTYTTRGAPSLFSPRWRGWDPQSTAVGYPPCCLVSNKFPNPNYCWGPRGPRQGSPCVPLVSPFGRNRLSSTQHGLGLILRESSET